MSSSSGAARRLALEFRKMSDAPVSGIVARPRDPANLLVWEFTIAGPEGSVYESGVFTGTLVFPADYPLAPPKMVFDTRITHPNVYGPGARAGEVCISILHTGHDFTGYERAEERWSSAQSVQSILLSVQSMMHDINLESPANVDAAKLMSQTPELFRRTVQAEVEASLGLRR